MDLSQRAVQANENFFFQFQIIILAENRKIFKGIARLEYWSKLNVLYINGFVSTSSTDKWKGFFSESFLNNGGVGFICACRKRHLCWSSCVLVVITIYCGCLFCSFYIANCFFFFFFFFCRAFAECYFFCISVLGTEFCLKVEQNIFFSVFLYKIDLLMRINY